MPTILLSDFIKYPAEAAIIGRMLAGYGEIEFELCNCLEAALGEVGPGLKAMFRLRSEAQRLDVADALMRHRYEKIGFAGEYGNAIGAVRFSKKIRNQYAHCHWWADEKHGLYFYNLESAAQIKSGEVMVAFQHIDVPLLEKQEEYFCYALDWLIFLKKECDRLDERIAAHDWKAPKIIEQPNLHNPRAEHPLPDPFPTYNSP